MYFVVYANCENCVPCSVRYPRLADWYNAKVHARDILEDGLDVRVLQTPSNIKIRGTIILYNVFCYVICY